ncbi:hypothetical protein E2C01_042215 [Portunus trituberculatus]|uniref:Uncharacterized protein n=1 Tax=Portunus trituberculatus TaxID=210409 RepID=A0A5B7FPL4_PORTR|nr:hypothetical protein [Portunus trituberculatus]
MMKAKGTCLVENLERMKACMEYSCIKGAFTRRNVPSKYQVFAAAKNFNWGGDESNKWHRGPTVMSPCKKSSGMASIFKSKLRSVGCFGRLTCRLLLATRIIADCVESEGQKSPTVTCLCTASVTKAETAYLMYEGLDLESKVPLGLQAVRRNHLNLKYLTELVLIDQGRRSQKLVTQVVNVKMLDFVEVLRRNIRGKTTSTESIGHNGRPFPHTTSDGFHKRISSSQITPQ